MNARRALRPAVAGMLLLVLSPVAGCGQERPAAGDAAGGAGADTLTAVSPLEALQTGDFDAAVTDYRTLVSLERELPGSARGLARALAATGRYEEALDELDAVEPGAAGPDGVEPGALDRTRGDLQRTLGRDEAAERSYRAAIAADADDALQARVGLAELLWVRGRRAEADSLFRSVVAGAAPRMGAEQLTAVGSALVHLGAADSDLFHDAVDAFEAAIDADPGDPGPRVALARLFLDKFDSRNAGVLLDDALRRNPRHAPALLALAHRARFDGSDESFQHVRASLDANPRYPAAHAFLAELHLELEEVERARAAAAEALRINPSFLPAWSALAAAAHLEGNADEFAEARDRVLSLDPGHAALYVTLADVAYRTRRYQDAVEFARRAVELDERSWAAHAALGMNQLRRGDMEAGQATLERSFAGDPFNVWVVNTLDLLDELETFETETSRRFVFRLHPEEAPVLSIYAPLLAEEAFTAMERRYGYAPPTPVSVEIYDRHADFSVRTLGVPGLGALGVSFGSVLAMDSPGARPPGDFNWGSTLWHEISHAFTLGYTRHRIPRWFSEGLAVLDERRARPGWGAGPDPGFLVAFREGRLPELERFDLGFVRPAYSGQVQHSYFLASLICEWIEDTRGIGAIRAMLDGYREGRDTPAVFEAALDAGVEEVERQLDAYIREQYATALESLDGVGSDAPPPHSSFPALVRRGAELREAGRSAEAVEALERARAAFPEYAGPGAPALQLARLHAEDGGDLAAAVAAYADYVSRNESDLEARLEYAGLQSRLGDDDGARETLASLPWIEPFAPELHARLAEAHETVGDWSGAVRERRALVALEPTDRAAAWYHLARAQQRAGDRAEARSSVLRSLEVAPNYREALDLLLELRREGGG